jgi:hypothetical protein
MKNTLVQYFIQFGTISLPGIGSLKLTKNESFWDNGKLVAPNEHILFEHRINEENNHLIQFIANDLGLTFEDANKQFDEYLNIFLIQQVTTLEFGNLGSFHKNGSKINWNSYYKAEQYYKNVTPKVFASQNEQAIKTDVQFNRHLITWTIIIIILSSLLIFYKNFSQ